EGKTVEEVRMQFEKAFKGVSASEITEAEQTLINEGMPVAEVQKLCDVHASVFKGSIEDIHKDLDISLIPGHPTNVLKLENEVISNLITERIRPYLDVFPEGDSVVMLEAGLDELSRIHIHYQKKENLLFPYMEKHGITAPPQVMWGVDDEIRNEIKLVQDELTKGIENLEEFKRKVDHLTEKIIEMIFKEENIMIPMLLENLTQEEWKTIYDESPEIGFLIDDIPHWEPEEVLEELKEVQNAQHGLIHMPTGVFKLDELVKVLDTLPLDITFVDKDDTVKFFSQGKERIFPRTKDIIGRKVSNCHPPASVHVVEKIIEDFRSGKKDNEDFWIKMGDQYIYIRYFAVRGDTGDYLGVLEVTQNIKPIQDITGEKRLLSD
ncbi:MAG TPA: PAS domain S-box protein, partial [Clostridiales bacterium]|nr:PAS domain S-box protein [Clostridiales bacterium]